MGDRLREFSLGVSTVNQMRAKDLEISDPVLAQFIVDGLERTEKLLDVESVSMFDPLTEISQHLLKAGGKRIRPVLVFIAGRYGQPDIERLAKVAAAIEFTHVATLYHDDVMDEAKVRRGVVSVNQRFGNYSAIMAGDFLFSRASALTAELGPHAVSVMAQTLATLCEGQIRETVGPEGEDRVTHYLKVLSQKTASLIQTAATLAAQVSHADDLTVSALGAYAENVGIAFQISDDILDLKGNPDKSGKLLGTDLIEGVYTLPVLAALEKDRTGELEGLLSKIDEAGNGVSNAIDLIEKLDGFEVAQLQLEMFIDKATTALDPIPAGSEKEALISFASWLTDRSS
ncbi:MAG: polyprenyl synthetase family protein [Candidatus Nanopelagicales bacterium]